MTKPFYQLALMTIDNPNVKGETIEHDVFKKQLKSLLDLLNKIHSSSCKAKKSQFQFTLSQDFECILKLLVTAENAFWYQYLLATQIPDLYARLISEVPKCKGIKISHEFTPRLLYNELSAANEKRPETKLSELFFTICSVMYWSDTTIAKMQIFKKASLSNLRLISAIEKCRGNDDLKILERKFADRILLFSKKKV